MSRLHKVFITAAALVSLILGVGAPIASAEDTLDGLLQEVAAARATEQQVFQQRAAAFNAAQASEQERMLREAQARRDALAANSEQLSAQFSANELKLNEFHKQLREKAANLGLARQVAGDAATVLQQSLISTQFPAAAGEQDRDDFLRNFAASRTTPTRVELERVWFELQREMTASGDVAKYPAKIVQPSGETVDAEVVRIGPFTAVADGKFLSYSPTLQTLNVFPRQPPEEFLGLAQQLGAVLGEVPKLERFQGLLRLSVAAGPLLGPIGTVTGMLEVFDSMALRGNADARSMASGVSQAMICTMTGLAVSITGLYPVHYFRTRAARETELLANRLPLRRNKPTINYLAGVGL